MAIAHKLATKGSKSNDPHKIDISELRSLLIYLFAIRILWAHFEMAENWEEEMGFDLKKELNREAFALAVHTFTETHAHEELTREQIDADFDLLDKNMNNSIGFMEVCTYCGRILSEAINGTSDESSKLPPKFFGTEKGVAAIEYLEDLKRGPKAYFESTTTVQKNSVAVDALASQIGKEMSVARQISSKFMLQDDESKATHVAAAEQLQCVESPLGIASPQSKNFGGISASSVG